MESSPLTIRQQVLVSLQRPLIQYLLLFLTVFCVYLPTLWYTFIWDDWNMIAHNEALREWRHIPRYFTDAQTFIQPEPHKTTLIHWRPIRNVYYLITYKAHGLHPTGWHLNHVLIYSLCACIILNFFRRIYRYATALPFTETLPSSVQLSTWFAVLIWAVHPANTEVAAWLKSADDILACSFGFGALIVLIHPTGRLLWSHVTVGCLLFACALLSKESIPPLAAIYPLIMLLLAPNPRILSRNRPVIVAAIIMLAETLLYIFLRDRLQGKTSQGMYLTGDFSLMMATMTTAILHYLQLTFWPFWPTVQLGSYDTWPLSQSWIDPHVILSIIIIGFCLAACAWLGQRNRIFLSGCVIAIFAFLPVANIIPMVQVMAERFMYFPLIGVALAASTLLTAWLRPPVTASRFWLPLVIACCLIFSTETRLPVWADDVAFQSDIVLKAPTDSRAIRNLGGALQEDGKFTEALVYFDKCIQISPPNSVHIYYSALAAARIRRDQKQYKDAVEYTEVAIQNNPKIPEAYLLAGDLLAVDGQTTRALSFYREALNREFETPPLYMNIALLNLNLGRKQDALQCLQNALYLDPDFKPATDLLLELKSQ